MPKSKENRREVEKNTTICPDCNIPMKKEVVYELPNKPRSNEVFECKIGESIFIRLRKDNITVELFEMLIPMLRDEFKEWKHGK